jgi:sigma-B regulation protein RsbU (phosphoserine phosphatase)
MAKKFLNAFSRKNDDIDALHEEIRQLKRAVEELTVLSDLAFAIGGTAEPQEMVETLIDKLMRAVSAEQAVVTLLDSDAKEDSMKTNLRLVATSAKHSALHMHDSITGWMYLHKQPLLMNDPKNDERFKGVKFDASIRSMMCVPLLVKSSLTGILTIYNKRVQEGFTQDDQRLLSIIAGQSAHLIENARLYKESVTLAHMKEQQENAYQIQKNLLPKTSPDIEGYDIAGDSTPAQTVGGDCFDFIARVDGRWAVCLGDVSGKGLPASLLMANLQATLRSQTLSDAGVDERIKRSNHLMAQSMDDEKFATLFYGELDTEAHQLTYCNAGHEYPLLYSGDGEPGTLESTGIAIGIMDDFDFGMETVALKPGDVLVVYSDGVTDATNENDEEFGIDRLKSSIEKHRNLPAAALIEAIFADVKMHEGKADQFDDLTIVVVRRTA